jgi:UDP-GlcNAc:undecaprenyl-phosphate GlcNAc-1-phosphate transferase
MSAPFPSSPWSAALAGWSVTLALTWLLARLAPRLGWVDAGDGGRKTQREPLPLVGGPAIALGLLAAWALGARAGAGLAAWLPGLAVPWVGPGLAAAFLLGLVDDLRPRGLGAAAKLAGQALCGALLAWPLLIGGQPLIGLALVGGTLVALNALNTYDNADGAAGALALLALAPTLPAGAAAVAGFLPFNVRRADGRALAGRLPRAILGDAGSHLLGMLVLVTPAAWPVLALPLLDLARVSVERLRAGSRPWRGDRRHLAHRLERRGLPPARVALLLAVVALPSAGLPHAALAPLPAAPWLLGVGATAALFVLAVALTRRRPALRPRGAAERAGLGLES